MITRALAVFFLLPFMAAAGEKIVYHVPVQGSTQLSCKITHKASKKEPYLLLTCEYRCDRPVRGLTVDVKNHTDTIYCRKDDPPSPAAQGSPIEEPPKLEEENPEQ